MRSRCYNPNDKSYKWYGGKGIRVCSEWLENPFVFEEWALSNGYSNELTIDRIDESKDYAPDNCRWVSFVDNAKYKSTTIEIEVDGESYSGREWADRLGLGTNTINTIRRTKGETVVKELIHKMLNNKPNSDVKRSIGNKQTWVEAYDIAN